MKKILNRLLPMLLCFLIVCSMRMSVFATDGDIAVPDLDQIGSVSVGLKEMTKGEAVIGVELTMYHIADAIRTATAYEFAYTDLFSECTEALDKVDSDELAGKIAVYATEHKIKGKTAVTDKKGKVVFDQLTTGLYLIVQNKVSSDYTTVKPFLVSVPLLVNEAYIYDVDASPKVGTVTKIDKPEKPVKPEKPQTPSGGKLPQTGQLWWPVCLLTVAGVLSFVYGWTRKKKISE